MDAVECAIYCSRTSNKRATNIGKVWTIEMAATEVNLLQLPITFPLNKTDHNLSLSLTLCRVGCYHRTAWVQDKWSERVYVCVWFMYCCVRVRRPSYQDHHLPIDIEMLQQWKDPSVDPETSDTHLEQPSTPSRNWRGLLEEEVEEEDEEEEVGSYLPCFCAIFIFIQRRFVHSVPSLSVFLPLSFSPLCRCTLHLKINFTTSVCSLSGIISQVAGLSHAYWRSWSVAFTLSFCQQCQELLLYDPDPHGEIHGLIKKECLLFKGYVWKKNHDRNLMYYH